MNEKVKVNPSISLTAGSEKLRNTGRTFTTEDGKKINRRFRRLALIFKSKKGKKFLDTDSFDKLRTGNTGLTRFKKKKIHH